MTATPNLQITYIDSAQAQKEVTANLAVLSLEQALTDTYAYQMPTNANQTVDAATARKCMVVVVTSAVTITATRTLTFPLSEKIYCIKNNVTGTQSIIVKGATGTGVTIAKGQEIWVRCDGTNFVRCGADSGIAGDGNAYLLNSTPTPVGSLPSAITIQELSSTLRFITSAAANTPMSVEGHSSQSVDILQIIKSSKQAAFDSSANLDLQNLRKVINCVDPTSAQHVATKNYIDSNFAPRAAFYLVKTADAGLDNEIAIDAISSTVEFRANGGGVTPLAARANSSPSVDVFQIKDNGGSVQAAFDSSFQLDMKTHKIIGVVDPTSAQHAATKNYHDTTSGFTLLNFCADSLTTSVGTTYFAWVNFITTVAATTERWVSLPKGGKISNLRVICAVAPAGGSVSFTVRKKALAGGTGAGSDTAVTCTVALGATEAHDTSNTVTVADGDEISVKIIENTGYSGSMVRIMISMMLTLA